MGQLLGPETLVGRARERELLREHWRSACSGQGRLVVIGGAAGIGKTTLAEAFLAEVSAGATALIGRCYDLTETPPYGPWRDPLATLARTQPGPALPGALLGDPDGATIVGQGAIFARMREALAARAVARPLALLLDDLHWADPASLDLLRFLARSIALLPILLLATFRTDDLPPHHPLAALLPAIVRESRAAQLDLRPLAEAEVCALLRARYALPPSDEGRLAAYLAGRAEGNPLYCGELLRSLEEAQILARLGESWRLGDLAGARLPFLLGQIIAGRVGRLGEAANAVLAAAATIGDEVPLALWLAAIGGDEAALLLAADLATGAGLLMTSPDGLHARFAHSLVREVLYQGLSTPRRRILHRRVAEALLERHEPDPDTVADHLRRAGDPRATEWLERAGARAQRAYAWRGATDRFAAALALREERGDGGDERGWPRLRLARLLRYADPRRGLAEVDRALRLAERGRHRALLAAARWQRGLLLCLAGTLGEGLDELAAGHAALDALPAEAREYLGAVQARLGVALVMESGGTLALWLALAGRYAEATTTGLRAIAAPRAPRSDVARDDDSRADAWYGLGLTHAALGDPDRARDAFASARAEYAAAGHQLLAASTIIAELAHATLPYRGHDVAARAHLATTLARTREQAANVVPVFPPAATLAALSEIVGEWAAARDGWAAAGASDPSAWRSTAAQVALVPLAIGRIARAQGDPAAAWSALDGLLGGPGDEPGGGYLAIGLGGLALAADLALDTGDLPRARAWLAARDRLLTWSGATLWRAEGALGWAAFYRAAGDLARAGEEVARALALAVDPGQPLALLAAHRLGGEVAAAHGDHGAARLHLAEALALADACAAPYERALILLALAELALATDDPAGAADAVDGARALLAPLAARPALARADALAARLAARATPGGEPLTAREVEVLRLVAEGLANRAIAARLSIAPRTVSTHLEHIFGKLGVATRTAAARAAQRAGLI